VGELGDAVLSPVSISVSGSPDITSSTHWCDCGTLRSFQRRGSRRTHRACRGSICLCLREKACWLNRVSQETIRDDIRWKQAYQTECGERGKLHRFEISKRCSASREFEEVHTLGGFVEISLSNFRGIGCLVRYQSPVNGFPSTEFNTQLNLPPPRR
jgi:hypothetical protein